MTLKSKEKKLDWLKQNSPFNWDKSEVDDEIWCCVCTKWFKLHEYKKRMISHTEGLSEVEVCPHCQESGPTEWVNKDVYDLLIKPSEDNGLKS